MTRAVGRGVATAVVQALVRRPWLWPTALRVGWSLAPRGWWRRWPPLPLPSPRYLRFRLVTQYGDPARAPDGDDVAAWLAWCRELHRRCAGAPSRRAARVHRVPSGEPWPGSWS